MILDPPFDELPSARGLSARQRPLSSVLSILLVAALSLAAACAGGGPARSEMPATLVQIERIHLMLMEDASEYVASIVSLSSTGIRPEVSGEVTRILVRSGDRVSAGTPLFVIDPRRQQATVSTQDATLQAQQAGATFAQQQLDRAKMLFAAGAISEQELQAAQSTYESVESQLAAQRARVQQERVTLQYYEVRAPADGTIGDIPIRVGAHVTSDTTLTTIDRNDRLEVYVQVPIERANDLRLGLPLYVVSADGQRLAETTVSFISPSVDGQTQSVLVKAGLTGAGTLRSLQFVRARLIWRTVEGLAVPVLSVVRVNGQPFVFVVEQEGNRLVATQRLVQLGPIVGNNVTVTGGLAANERIVVSGVQKLSNGAPVRPA